MGKLGNETPRLLSYAQLASRWSLSERQVHRWLRRYGVEPLRIGKGVRYRAHDIQRFERMFGIPHMPAE